MTSSGVLRPVVEVTSYLGGELLGVVPIGSGTVTLTSGHGTLGQLVAMVPARGEWLPTHPGHPLAAYGQELLVRRGQELPTGETVDWTILGRFMIRESDPDGMGWIRIVADSVDVRLVGARWIVATRTEGTYAEQAAQICDGVVDLDVDAPDRAAGARTWEQQQPRRESLDELLDAWGAVLRMVDGNLTVVPLPTGEDPDATVRSGDGGTVVQVEVDNRGDRVPNVVVASSAPEDETEPVSAMETISSGPRDWRGPYGQEVLFYASPLLKTAVDCQAAARTRLASVTESAPDLSVTLVSDPTIVPGTVVQVVTRDTDALIRASEAVIALTGGDEPGRIRGQVLSGTVRGLPWL